MNQTKAKTRVFSIALPASLHKRLKMAAAKMDTSQRALLREALEQQVLHILGPTEEGD